MADPIGDVTDQFYPSTAFIGYGTQFEVQQADAGSPLAEVWAAVPEAVTIDKLVELTTGVVEVTHLRSEDATREKIATLSDASVIKIAGTYRPAHGAHLLAGGDGFDADHNLQALRKSRARNNFRFILPDEAGLEGSPATAIALPLVGVVTRYMVGPLDKEQPVGFEVDVTPTKAYFAR